MARSRRQAADRAKWSSKRRWTLASRSCWTLISSEAGWRTWSGGLGQADWHAKGVWMGQLGPVVAPTGASSASSPTHRRAGRSPLAAGPSGPTWRRRSCTGYRQWRHRPTDNGGTRGGIPGDRGTIVGSRLYGERPPMRTLLVAYRMSAIGCGQFRSDATGTCSCHLRPPRYTLSRSLRSGRFARRAGAFRRQRLTWPRGPGTGA